MGDAAARQKMIGRRLFFVADSRAGTDVFQSHLHCHRKLRQIETSVNGNGRRPSMSVSAPPVPREEVHEMEIAISNKCR